MSRFDQPGDESWRDRISRVPKRTCTRCGKEEWDEGGPSEYLVQFLCEQCLRELWAERQCQP